MDVIRALRHSLTIRRPEFLVAEVPIVALPLLLADTVGMPWGWPAWAGVGTLILLFHLGDIANCLADRELDAVHKPHLARAVHGLGLTNVRCQLVLSGIGAMALAAAAGWGLDRWWLPVLALIGLVAGLAYSLPPVRLKGRGAWQFICLWAIIFAGPMLFAACLRRAWPEPALLLVIAAYATAQMGVILVNTAEDLPEDRAAGLRTVVLALGLPRSLALAPVLTALGGVGLAVGLAWHALGRGASGAHAGWALAAAVVPMLATVDLLRLRRRAASTDEKGAIAAVRAAVWRVPLWLTLVAWGTLGVAAWLRTGWR